MGSLNIFKQSTLVTFLFLSLLINTNAQTSVVVPNASATVGNSNFFSGPFNSQARTFQLIIASSQLTGLVNNQLSSITFRLAPQTPAAFPNPALTYSNYDIYLAQSVAPQNRSLTFNNNIVGTKTLVRSGALTLPLNSFPVGNNPNNFGHTLTFNTNYLYTGGNLVIEVRHSGNSSGTGFANEAIPATQTGYGTLFTSCFGTTYNATSGSQANFTVVRINQQNLSQTQFEESSFSIFPNPTSDFVTISSEIDIDNIQIFNQLGQVVLEKKLNINSEKIDISNLGIGIYFLKITSGLTEKTTKIIKN